MLTEFDQSTIANMTAALNFVSKKIAVEKDSNELRKRIADELTQCARTGPIRKAGMKILEHAASEGEFSWLVWWLKQTNQYAALRMFSKETRRNGRAL